MKDAEVRQIRLAWAAGIVILLILLSLELLLSHQAHFQYADVTIDTWPLFYPAYGFLSCFLLLVLARTVAIMLVRKDTYYDRQ